MDAIIDKTANKQDGKTAGDKAPRQTQAQAQAQAQENKPSRAEAEKAVRTLIAWAGDDPSREGLADTPKRVVEAYKEFFAGYEEDPDEVLRRTFKDSGGYNDIVMLRDITLESHCEHHMVAILGTVHVAYMPIDKIVGISKLARVVEIFAKRLQTQENMTAQIANCIQRSLEPAGVAVLIDAKHQCMTTRGVKKPNVATITTQFTGVFADDPHMEARCLALVNNNSNTKI